VASAKDVSTADARIAPADMVRPRYDATPQAKDALTADSNGDPGEAPFGWEMLRCGEQLVDTCVTCPGKPFACEPCELSAVCVADCGGECKGRTSCPAKGTCAEEWQTCFESTFCGCPGKQKECHSADGISCVDNCSAECAGQPGNHYGVCSDTTGGPYCLDNEGPEYWCPGAGSCVDSCNECGAVTCISQSCAGEHCDEGFLPDFPYYVCGVTWCCDAGFLCPSDSKCVSDCAECGTGYVGACGERGVCVKDCVTCPVTAEGQQQLEVCDGICTDVLSDRWHCGSCNEPCGTEWDVAECSLGHCCIGSMSDMPPFDWCGLCDCCLQDMYECTEAGCQGCI